MANAKTLALAQKANATRKKNARLLEEARQRDKLRKLRRLKELKLEQRYRAARDDFMIFQQVVMQRPDGGFWEPAPIHREWDRFFSENPRAVRWAPIEHGKTEQRSIAKTLHLIGQNCNLRQVLISQTYGQAVKNASAIKQYIEESEEYHRVFPLVKPAKGKKWSESHFTVERDVIHKDPTVLAQGVGGAILGSRIDRLVVDDILSFANTLTEEQRNKSFAWILAELIGRLTEDSSFETIGTAWHRADAMHKLAALDAFVSVKDRACTLHVEDGELQARDPLWPQQWSGERLLKRRKEIGELEFSRQMLNEALTEGMSRFKQEWFEAAFALAEQLGFAPMSSNPENLPAYTGVDLAVGKKSFHDQTQLCTSFLHPNHPTVKHLRSIASLHGGHMEGHKIVKAIVREHDLFNSHVMVESNAAQEYIRDWVKQEGVATQGHVTTGPKKYDPEFGIESLAVELQNGMWAIPRTPDTEQLAREAIYYDPTAHTGDRLIAWWLSREGLRSYGTASRSRAYVPPDDPTEAASIMGGSF